jgi:hypothetical protein
MEQVLAKRVREQADHAPMARFAETISSINGVSTEHL